MRTLGITGGIGSGKSTVCKLLEELGARVFYADAEGRNILLDDADVRSEIIEAFGGESYLPDGSPNRPYLADRVFGDPANVAQINAIIHPRVFARFEEARQRAEEEGVQLLVKEAALIFESGGDRFLDAVAIVDAPMDVRIRRVVERDNVSPEQVTARMSHQLPPEELRRRADYVIENNGDFEDLRRQVERVYEEVLSPRS